jgi:menaquinone-dependent protoporphyrinogen oxidase
MLVVDTSIPQLQPVPVPFAKDYPMPKILVTYASKHGSTAEIAQAIGKSLSERGHAVDIYSVDVVQSTQAYEAIVLGSAVYSGRWMKDAITFLQIHHFGNLPFFIFSSGPIGDDNPETLRERFPLPEIVQRLSQSLNVKDAQVFHGKIDIRKLSLAELMLFKSIGAQTGDFRRWDRIKFWAQHISDILAQDAV